MKTKSLVILFFSLFCTIIGHTQRVLHLKDVRKMMVAARVKTSSPCFLIPYHKDTVWGKEIEKKWNKTLKIYEIQLDEMAFDEDSVSFYQDKDGFHYTRHTKIGTTKYKYDEDLARIVTGQMEVFISNWDSRGSASTFNPGFTPGSRNLDPSKAGYVPGTGSYSPSQYYIRKPGGKLISVTYGTFKEFIKDNSAALAKYNEEIKSDVNPDGDFTNWGIMKSIIEIYNNTQL